MSDTPWNTDEPLCSVGFVAVYGITNINFARSSYVVAKSSLQTELIAIRVALEQCKDKKLAPKAFTVIV